MVFYTEKVQFIVNIMYSAYGNSIVFIVTFYTSRLLFVFFNTLHIKKVT